jgi:hypothetical protein
MKSLRDDIFDTYVVWLSEFIGTVCELTELSQGAFPSLEEVLAHLGLILLLQSVELTLVSVEVVVVGLLCEVSHDFAWWVVEVLLWLAILTQLSSVSGLWLTAVDVAVLRWSRSW